MSEEIKSHRNSNKRKLNEIEDNGADIAPSLIEKAGPEQALEELAEGPWTTFEVTVIGFKIDGELVKECGTHDSEMPRLQIHVSDYLLWFCVKSNLG